MAIERVKSYRSNFLAGPEKTAVKVKPQSGARIEPTA
jgi:hypothetical protein